MIIHKENKFKSVFISVRFKEEITKNNVGLRALLPNVMSSSTPTYKTRQALNQALINLYGSSISARTTKIGKLSVVSFSLSMINPNLMDEGYFEEGLKVLHEIIFGHKNLPKKEFELEKRLLLEKALQVNNDKTYLSLITLFETMFKNERYGIRVSGKEEDILPVTYNNLNKYYQELILNNDYDVVVTGDVDDEIKALISKYFISRNDNSLDPIEDEIHKFEEVTEINDFENINQAKLNLGYNFPVNYHGEDFNAAVLLNISFGGSAHSRLFKNVREKHSLCYYISSTFDPYKGFMYVYTGIDKRNVNLTKKLIAENLKDLQTNLLSEEELDLSKKSLINSLKSVQDSQGSWANNMYQSYLLNNEESLEERIDKINKVRPIDLLNVAKKINLDTVYILSPEEE